MHHLLIQIQLLLKLNARACGHKSISTTNSNTTLVKVKLNLILFISGYHFYSNTTLVKVKFVVKKRFYEKTVIQIQLLLKLNDAVPGKAL